MLFTTMPMWSLILIGFVIGRCNVIGSNADEILSRYTFYCGMPAFLFLSLLQRDIAQTFQFRFLICFAASAAVSMVISVIIAARILRLAKMEIPLFLMSTSYVNSINLGVPLLLYTVGDALPAIIVNVFQLLIVSPSLILWMEQYANSATAGGVIRRSLGVLVGNPIIIATALGLVGSMTHLQLPALIESPLALLGQAAVPTALLALGLTLAKISVRELRGITLDLQMALPIKLMLQPMIAGMIGYFLIGLKPQWLIAAVLTAGLPAPQNVVIFAQKYQAYIRQSAGVVFFSSLMSMVTLFVLLWLIE